MFPNSKACIRQREPYYRLGCLSDNVSRVHQLCPIFSMEYVCMRVEIPRMFLYLQLTLAMKVYDSKKITP